ncbi:hypothetical protein [Corynebacterium sp. A21]|uniref:hypothetical protein n=1 Tax=Corynebacterium sp. A21 TaxID=3457318 RepID=UPI003FD3C532
MIQETLALREGSPGLQALLGRAVGLDASASARLRQRGEQIEVFVTTPFEVVGSRRATGTVGRDGAVVGAHELLQALQNDSTEIGLPRDPNWPGALPPVSGFALVDTLPVTVVRELADQGQALARQFSGPLGPPANMLNQTVLTVSGNGLEAEVSMRMIFTCTALGLIPGFAAPIEIPRHLRVSVSGRWVRIDAPYGSVYRSTGLSLF